MPRHMSRTSLGARGSELHTLGATELINRPKKIKLTVFVVPNDVFCKKVKTELRNLGWAYNAIDVEEHPDRKADMLLLTDKLTCPQVFFGSKHLGNATDFFRLHSLGLLEERYYLSVAQSGAVVVIHHVSFVF